MKAVIKHPLYPQHKQAGKTPEMAREIVFGLEDGMVSTLGAITGVAAGTQDIFTVVLAGFVIISVESISMGVGSFISNKSRQDIKRRLIKEEMQELKTFPKEEREELRKIYINEGWPKKLAQTMAQTASRKKKLFLSEMAHHELNIIPGGNNLPWRNSFLMFVSYIIGGMVPMLAYFILPLGVAVITSVIVAIMALFLLGVGTSRFTKRTWWRAGLELLSLASLAALVGYFISQLVNAFWLK